MPARREIKDQAQLERELVKSHREWSRSRLNTARLGNERAEAIIKAREAGMSFGAIADTLDLTPARVNQIVKQHERATRRD